MVNFFSLHMLLFNNSLIVTYYKKYLSRNVAFCFALVVDVYERVIKYVNLQHIQNFINKKKFFYGDL